MWTSEWHITNVPTLRISESLCSGVPLLALHVFAGEAVEEARPSISDEQLLYFFRPLPVFSHGETVGDVTEVSVQFVNAADFGVEPIVITINN